VDEQGFTRPETGGPGDGSSSLGWKAGTPNVEVCLQSDEKGFVELLMGRIAGETDPSSAAARH